MVRQELRSKTVRSAPDAAALFEAYQFLMLAMLSPYLLAGALFVPAVVGVDLYGLMRPWWLQPPK